MELVYLFDTFDSLFLIPTPGDERVADMMQRAWGGFALTGAPTLETGWPAYDPAEPAIAVLDDPATITDEIAGGRCEALEALGMIF